MTDRNQWRTAQRLKYALTPLNLATTARYRACATATIVPAARRCCVTWARAR